MILYSKHIIFHSHLSDSMRLTLRYRSSNWTRPSHNRGAGGSYRKTPYNAIRRLHPLRHCDFGNQDIHLAALSLSLPDPRYQLGNKDHCRNKCCLGIRNSPSWDSLLQTREVVLGYHDNGKKMHQYNCLLHREFGSTRCNRYRHSDSTD